MILPVVKHKRLSRTTCFGLTKRTSNSLLEKKTKCRCFDVVSQLCNSSYIIERCNLNKHCFDGTDERSCTAESCPSNGDPCECNQYKNMTCTGEPCYSKGGKNTNILDCPPDRMMTRLGPGMIGKIDLEYSFYNKVEYNCEGLEYKTALIIFIMLVSSLLSWLAYSLIGP